MWEFDIYWARTMQSTCSMHRISLLSIHIYYYVNLAEWNGDENLIAIMNITFFFCFSVNVCSFFMNRRTLFLSCIQKRLSMKLVSVSFLQKRIQLATKKERLISLNEIDWFGPRISPNLMNVQLNRNSTRKFSQSNLFRIRAISIRPIRLRWIATIRRNQFPCPKKVPNLQLHLAGIDFSSSI